MESDDPWASVRDAPALAAVLLARHIAAAARDRDGAQRLLSLATAGLRAPGAEWGAAMRAELASIDGQYERHRFARSAGAAAMLGWRVAELTVAAAVSAAMVALALLLSTLVVGIEPDGGLLLGGLIRTVVLFAVALTVALRTHSFRTGLEVGLLALLGTVVGVFAVRAIEAIVWADLHGLDLASTMLDALSPAIVGVHLVGLTPWPVLGAALGARLAQRGGRAVINSLKAEEAVPR